MLFDSQVVWPKEELLDRVQVFHGYTSEKEDDLLCGATSIDRSVVTHCTTIRGALGWITCDGDVATESGVSELIDGVDSMTRKSVYMITEAKRQVGLRERKRWCQA